MAKDITRVYDIEVFPNMFLIVFKSWVTGERKRFEVSPRTDDRKELNKFLVPYYIDKLIGFNNVSYDSAVLAYYMRLPVTNSRDTVNKLLFYYSQKVINKTAERQRSRFKQLDLYKIWHYDNKARATSLKKLQISMNWWNVLESEQPFDEPVKDFDEVVYYCDNDVDSTENFGKLSLKKIRQRQDIERDFNIRCANYSDSKLGEALFVQEICKTQLVGEQELRASVQQIDRVELKEVIVPISYHNEKYGAIYDKLKTVTIWPKKEKKKGKHTKRDTDVAFLVQNLRVDIKEGGIHGSLSGEFNSDDEYVVLDADISSMYPSTIINLNIYPKHIGPIFNKIMAKYYKNRLEIKKKLKQNTDKAEIDQLKFESETWKLAMNSAYGKLGSEWSPLYDPRCVYKTTINGQLYVLKWIEMLELVPSLEFIQVNTDGMTVRIKRSELNTYKAKCKEFEELSGYELEYKEYKRIAIRDVNNYCALDVNGGVKTKGEYVYELKHDENPDYHKTINFKVSRRAAVRHLLFDDNFSDSVVACRDIFDFVGSTRFKKPKYAVDDEDETDEDEDEVTKNEELFEWYAKVPKVKKSDASEGWYIDTDGNKRKTQSVIRFVYGKGETLWKYYLDGRVSKMFEGKSLIDCNRMDDAKIKFAFENMNYDKYVMYARKLINAVKEQQIKM